MSDVRIDCDLVAKDIRQRLDNAKLYLLVQADDVNYASGVVQAHTAQEIADLVFRNLEPHQEDDRERFGELRKEALKLANKFWTRFKVVALPLSNGTVVTARPAENVAPVQRPIFKQNGHTRTQRRTDGRRQILTENDVRDIRKWAHSLGRNPRQDGMAKKGTQYGVSHQAIYQVVHRITWKHIS